MPCTSVPLTPVTTVLKLSKVPSAIWDAEPPLGAFGLPESNFLKPSGSFSAPHFVSPCRQTGAAPCPLAEVIQSGKEACPPASTTRADLSNERRFMRYSSGSRHPPGSD